VNAAQLQAVPGWTALPNRDAVALTAIGVDRWFKAGVALGPTQNADSGPMLLVSGEAKVLIEVGDLSLVVATLGPGDWWNADASTDGAHSPLSLRTLTDVKAFLVPREQWGELPGRSATAGAHLLTSVLASQLRMAHALSPLVARWQAAAAARRRPTRKDLVDLGMVKLVAPTARPDGAGAGQVEVIGHQGTAVAAMFRQNR